MKLRIKVLVLIFGIAAMTGVAAVIRGARDARRTISASAGSAPTQPSTRPEVISNREPVAASADAHLLRLLTPDDPEFNARLDQEYPGLQQVPELKDLRSKIILVQNHSPQPIHAFVIRWTLQNPGQAPTVSYSSYMTTKTPGHLLPTGVVLAPKESRLLSPWFSLSTRQFANIRTLNAPARALSAFLHLNISASAKDASVLNSTVDGVVFADTRFVGPDEYKLADRFEGERNGQHDEDLSVLHALQNGDSNQQVIDRLTAHIERGKAYKDHADREGFYYLARAAQAQTLLEMLRQDGRSKLQQEAEGTVKRIRRVALQK